MEIVQLGETAFTPHILGFLKKASYFMNFDARTATITLYGNDGYATVPLLTATQTTLDNARKLATMLGLPPHGDMKTPTMWGKKVHFFILHYNDTEGARTLYNALVDNGVSHDVIYHSDKLLLEYDGKHYDADRWTISQLVGIIKSAALKSAEAKPAPQKFIIG